MLNVGLKFPPFIPSMNTPEIIANIEVDELKEIIHTPSEQIRNELLEVLKLCGIPEQNAILFEHDLKRRITDFIKKQKLPEENWLIDALYNIHIHILYLTTKRFQQCIFKEDLTTQL